MVKLGVGEIHDTKGLPPEKYQLYLQSLKAGADHEQRILESIPKYKEDIKNPPEEKFQARGWIGVDFDGTLATYLKKWKSWEDLGKPVPKMIDRVKKWIKMGVTVKVLTARVGKASLEFNHISYSQQAKVIQDWCKKYIGQELEVTAEKDMFMVAAVDDAIVQVKQSTGEPQAEDGFDMLDERVANYLKEVKKHKYDYLKEKKNETVG